MKGVLKRAQNRLPELTRAAFASAFDTAIALAHEDYQKVVDPLIEKYGAKNVQLFTLPQYLVNQELKRVTAQHHEHVALLEEYKKRAVKIYDEERIENES